MRIMKTTAQYLMFLCVMAVMTAAGAQSKKVYQWRIAETWPADFPMFGDANRMMMQYARELSAGRLIISSDTKEVHKRPLEVLDMVQSGEYQMGHSASYYWRDKDVNTVFFTSLPFGMITPEMQAWFYEGGGLELMQKTYAKHGVYSFPGGNSGNQMSGWFRKRINSLDDMKGLRMRLPGLAGDVMQDLGVETVNIPAGELYAALEAGKIDAVEWVGPSMDVDMRFSEIASFYYTGWHEPGTELQFLVNQDAYNALPEDLQYVLKTAMRLAAYDAYTLMMHTSSLKLRELRTQYPNIKIQAFPPDVMTALKRSTAKKIKELAARGGLTQEIADSVTAYQEQIRLWTRIGDQAYLNNTGL